MNCLIALLISSIAGFSTLLGSLLIFIKISKNSINKFITLCLSFSCVIMIGISIIDLIPSSYFYIINKYSLFLGSLIAILVFLFGGCLIILISKKIDNNELKTPNLYKLGVLNMIALIIHNLPEGMATFLSSYTDINLGIKLSIAIMLHNIPEGISIAIPIYYATNNKKIALKYTFLSGFAEPIGAILAFILFKGFINNLIISITLILVAGIMIFLSINKIYNETLKYKEYKYIKYGFLIGILFITISLII